MFENCLKDIDVAVKFAIEKGYRKIYLQGHSLPHKCIYYHIKKDNPYISGIISICNSDLLFEFTKYTENYEENLKLAKALIDSGQGDRIMPVLMWAGAYASAKTYYSYGNSKGNAHIFSFFNPKFKYETLKKISVPILYVEPETDFFIGIDPREALDICVKNTKKAKASSLFIPRASHSFINFEEELCKGIIDWIKK